MELKTTQIICTQQYKQSFTRIIKYYQRINPNVFFYNLHLSETFGINDKRVKIIKVLKDNYKRQKNKNKFKKFDFKFIKCD